MRLRLKARGMPYFRLPRVTSKTPMAQATSAAVTLGRLHLALADLPVDCRRPPRLMWDGTAWGERLEKVERAILARSVLTASDHVALDRTRAQRAWLAHPECRHSDDMPNALQITHGDYHHRNLFFSDQQVSAVIDWEQTSLMPRAYEAIRAATYMFGLEGHCARAFLTTWAEEVNASAEELHRGAEIFALVRDHWVWALEEVYISGNAAASAFIPAEPFEPFLQSWARLR